MIEYYRLSGGGNDFLALVEPDTEPADDEIRAWCRRGVSLGADGLFVLRRTGTIGDGTVRMDYFNADGRAADLCLNGTRCAARLAIELGWTDEGERLEIETGAGRLPARPAGGDRIEIELPAPAQPRPVEVEAAGRSWRGWSITVGVPHFVVLVDARLATMEIDAAGRALRHHERFAPAGTNVDWVEPAAGGSGGFAIRTWERGVEAETLACGTGVLAAAAAAVAAGRIELPAEARTRGGFPFTVRGASDGTTITSWSLTGDARILARGEIYPGAFAQPPG